MWHDTRRGRNLIKKRHFARKFKVKLLNIGVVIVSIFAVSLGIWGLSKLKKDDNNIEKNAISSIYKEDITKANNIKKDDIQDDEIKEDVDNKNTGTNNDDKENTKEFNITFLGEIMMGGNIQSSLNYNYMTAFKAIKEYTEASDYTVCNLATNIIDLETITSTTSKYIVNKKIINAFNALGIDGINVATDHIMDFGKEILKNTLTYLEEDKLDIIGLNKNVIYAEKDGIKIAIIGVCNEVIGSERSYTNAGIMMYNLSTLKSMIKEAKQNVNTVIMLTHLGLENTYTVTDIMSWFYRELIKAGADIVLGDHAIGIYPVDIYNSKPIIYSMGYLMSDTDYERGKETGIFNLKIDEQGYLESLEIIPLYIKNKSEVVIYSEYNEKRAVSLMKLMSQNLPSNVYKISDNEKIVINLKAI